MSGTSLPGSMAGTLQTDEIAAALLANLQRQSGKMDFERIVAVTATQVHAPSHLVSEVLRQLIDSGRVYVTMDWNLMPDQAAAAE